MHKLTRRNLKFADLKRFLAQEAQLNHFFPIGRMSRPAQRVAPCRAGSFFDAKDIQIFDGVAIVVGFHVTDVFDIYVVQVFFAEHLAGGQVNHLTIF